MLVPTLCQRIYVCRRGVGNDAARTFQRLCSSIPANPTAAQLRANYASTNSTYQITKAEFLRGSVSDMCAVMLFQYLFHDRDEQHMTTLRCSVAFFGGMVLDFC